MYPEELAHLLRESYKGLQALPAYVVSHIRDAAPAIVILLPSGLLATALWSYQNARLSAALIEVDRASRPDAVPSPITLDKRLDLQKDLLKTEFDARAAIVQIGLGAGVLASLYFTYRNMRTSQENLRVSNETLLTSQKGQITERFTRAIDQLGATDDGKPNFEVRLGGIYALEGIARDSEEYRTTVVEVLSAYARQHAEPPDRQLIAQEIHRVRPRQDVAAILGAFSRLRDLFGAAITPDLRGIDLQRHVLHDVRLPGADLSSANLTDAALNEGDFHDAQLGMAILSGAILWGTNLTDADLAFADLSAVLAPEAKFVRAKMSPSKAPGANLSKADFTEARLAVCEMNGADLTGANLTRADLHFAQLKEANLTGATLRGANLTLANLTNANLTGVDLDGVDLSGAILTGTSLDPNAPAPSLTTAGEPIRDQQGAADRRIGGPVSPPQDNEP